jgi:hypothetical protein
MGRHCDSAGLLKPETSSYKNKLSKTRSKIRLAADADHDTLSRKESGNLGLVPVLHKGSPLKVSEMKLSNIRYFQVKTLARVMGCLVLISPCQLAPQTATGAGAPGPYDGTYVPDTSRNSGSPTMVTKPCLPSESVAFGQGLTVDKSIGKFLVGVQPQGAPKIKPDRASGKVDAAGNLAISQGMVRVNGRFDGPASGVIGHQNTFSGQLILNINSKTSCAYSLILIHGADLSPKK